MRVAYPRQRRGETRQDRSRPTTSPGKALTYLDNQWLRLIGYLDDGVYPIDNKRAENAIRTICGSVKIIGFRGDGSLREEESCTSCFVLIAVRTHRPLETGPAVRRLNR